MSGGVFGDFFTNIFPQDPCRGSFSSSSCLFPFQFRMTHCLHQHQSSPLHQGLQTHCSFLNPCWHDSIRYRFEYLPMDADIYLFIPDEMLAKNQMWIQEQMVSHKGQEWAMRCKVLMLELWMPWSKGRVLHTPRSSRKVLLVQGAAVAKWLLKGATVHLCRGTRAEDWDPLDPWVSSGVSCKPAKIVVVIIIMMMVIRGRVQSGRISGRCAMNLLLLLYIVSLCWDEGVNKPREQSQAQTIEPYLSPPSKVEHKRMGLQNGSKMKELSGLQVDRDWLQPFERRRSDGQYE